MGVTRISKVWSGPPERTCIERQGVRHSEQSSKTEATSRRRIQEEMLSSGRFLQQGISLGVDRLRVTEDAVSIGKVEVGKEFREGPDGLNGWDPADRIGLIKRCCWSASRCKGLRVIPKRDNSQVMAHHRNIHDFPNLVEIGIFVVQNKPRGILFKIDALRE
ncbi:MAG: hypothetical protein CMJ34_06660 [Phycisphaerae bacterium]|nr:hypothetical protein [Phycisphaerae bacterium]